MPAERAGYTVTMFVVDVSQSMGKRRTVEQDGPNGEQLTTEMTNLEWSLQYVKLKIQEMIYNGRKTDQCGVIVYGSEETNNVVNSSNNGSGYENVLEYIPIGQPNTSTLAKLDALQPSEEAGDPIDALIVAIETQAQYLASKKSWTRKIVLVTDGENPIETEDWELTVEKMNNTNVSLIVVGIDFDDEEFGFKEEDKSEEKANNEGFFREFTAALNNGVLGTYAFALSEVARPDVKQTKSVLMGTVLRIGDVDMRSNEAAEIMIKTSKATAIARPKSWKKYAIRGKKKKGEDAMDVDDEDEDVSEGGEKRLTYGLLKMRTQYFVEQGEDKDEDGDGDTKMAVVKKEEEVGANGEIKPDVHLVEKEELVRGFKYGTTYVPCPDGQFPRLPTKKGIDICGFFPRSEFQHHLAMSEVQYVWADPSSASQQVALSSIVLGMLEKEVVAIARWVTKDGMDPKMGVLYPEAFEKVHCLLWVQMPFADDVRQYRFASLDNLVSKKGEVVTEHPYLPTEEQLRAMDKFVDAMDLSMAAEDDEGNKIPWFSTLDSYNPAIHRVKQAMFHCAVVSDLDTNPLPPPHPELLKYFDPPKKVVKRARDTVEKLKNVMKVKHVPKRVAKARKDGHQHAYDDDEDMLLLDRKQPAKSNSDSATAAATTTAASSSNGKAQRVAVTAAAAEDSGTEDEEEEELLHEKGSKKPEKDEEPKRNRNHNPLPTPARSVSPRPAPASSSSLQFDPQIDPGRIIGRTYPLKDFKKSISARGADLVTKAVEDLGVVITEIVSRPFANKRKDELVECMTAMRDTCLQEDEVDAWNSFLRELKDTCLVGSPGNKAFWSEVQNVGRELSLISRDEARKNGGDSDVTEKDAKKFLS